MLGEQISNVFDCGVETSGVIANAIIANNRISNIGICGIGGWYWNSLSGSSISGNTVEGAPALFQFFRVFGLRPAGFDGLHEMPADSAVLFNDNTFDGNRLVNPSARCSARPCSERPSSPGSSSTAEGMSARTTAVPAIHSSAIEATANRGGPA